MSVINFEYSQITTDILVSYIKNEYIELNPFKCTWNKEQKESFIKNLCLGFPVTNIVLDKQNNILKGKNKIITLYKFLNDDLLIKKDQAREIVKNNINYFTKESFNRTLISILTRDYLKHKKIELVFSSLPNILQEKLKNSIINITILNFRKEDKSLVENYINEY